MNVSTDGFAKLLLKSFFSLLLCTYFPQLLQGSRKPPQESDLSLAWRGLASTQECSCYSSSGRARAPGRGRAGGWGACVATASSELAASCRRGVRGSKLATVQVGSLRGLLGAPSGQGERGRRLLGQAPCWQN